MTPPWSFISRWFLYSLRCWRVVKLREALLREQWRFGVAAMNGLKVTALGRLSKRLKSLRAVPARPCSLAACSRKNTTKAACKSSKNLHLSQKSLRIGRCWGGKRAGGWLSVVLVQQRIKKGDLWISGRLKEKEWVEWKKWKYFVEFLGSFFLLSVAPGFLWFQPVTKKQALLGGLGCFQWKLFMSIIQNTFSTNWFGIS